MIVCPRRADRQRSGARGCSAHQRVRVARRRLIRVAFHIDSVIVEGPWLRHVPAGVTPMYVRTHPATTAGSAAASLTPCAWPTARCAPGPSGTAISPKPEYLLTSRSPGTCGAMTCSRWRWPTVPFLPGSSALASRSRGRVEEVGRASRRWANSCTRRVGVVFSSVAPSRLTSLGGARLQGG